MPKRTAILKSKLRGVQRLAILGVGSLLRGDDGAGVIIAQKIRDYIQKKGIKSSKVFLGETAPENLTGVIKRFHPTHLLILDAVDFQKKAGEVRFIESDEEIKVSFSTHKLPVAILRDYLNKSIGCQTVIVGIQPQSLEFNARISRKVQQTLSKLSKEICGVITDL